MNHVVSVDRYAFLDYIPVDFCVKGMIISACKTWREINYVQEIPIYNAAAIIKSSFVSFHHSDVLQKNPPLMAVMYQSAVFTKCKFFAWIVRIVENLIPALIIDCILSIGGKKKK